MAASLGEKDAAITAPPFVWLWEGLAARFFRLSETLF
jgi:hypothetical protein